MRRDIDAYAPILEMICRKYIPGWLLVARWYLETGTPSALAMAKEAARRFLEEEAQTNAAADGWRLLAQACYRSGDALGEVHALIERSQIQSIPFPDLSNTASMLNRLLSTHAVEVGRDDRRRLAAVLERRRSEADAVDYSRMAWLALHLSDEAKAAEYVRAGLECDPDDLHCLRLAMKLEVS